jgi:hypothetical protein
MAVLRTAITVLTGVCAAGDGRRRTADAVKVVKQIVELICHGHSRLDFHGRLGRVWTRQRVIAKQCTLRTRLRRIVSSEGFGFSRSFWRGTIGTKPSLSCALRSAGAGLPTPQACGLCRIGQRGPTWPLTAAGVMVGESSSNSSSRLSRSDMLKNRGRRRWFLATDKLHLQRRRIQASKCDGKETTLWPRSVAAAGGGGRLAVRRIMRTSGVICDAARGARVGRAAQFTPRKLAAAARGSS